MSFEAEAFQGGTDLSKVGETCFDPKKPIEVTAAKGGDDNPGTSTVAGLQLHEKHEDPGSTTGA